MKWLSRKFLVYLVNIIIVIGMIIKGYNPNTEMIILILGNAFLYSFIEGVLDIKKIEGNFYGVRFKGTKKD